VRFSPVRFIGGGGEAVLFTKSKMVLMQGLHEQWMRRALALARAAGERGNVPVGAVVVVDDVIVASGMNLRQVLQDPTAHAEMSALSAAGQRQRSWRLDHATLVVTLEPCAMCAATIAQSRVGRLIYGAREEKTGAVHSTAQLLDGTPTEVIEGVLADQCAATMSAFFETLRQQRRGGSTPSSGR